MVRPSGTVTFVFTDVEGSTRRWEADPEAMRSALAAHDEVLRTAVSGHDGWLFKHTGDGICAAFSAAGDAVAAAVDAQRRLGLPVRMGIATGTAELRGEDYFGPVLNRAARIMAAGHGGQVLLAAATASLLSGSALIDLGERRLRDLSGAEHLYQVRAEGLRTDFPPLRTLDTTPGNLPVQPTSFIGRDADVKELLEVVITHPLVTLTGVGGVGKTRLAVQAAAELAGDYPDGVWLVELAPVGDPAAVPDVLAAALGVTPQGGMSVTASVVQALSGRRLLMVLDNCEHLLDAAADLVETILARASTVTVIATSREGLRLGGEQLWPVPSLDLSGGASSAAVELFVERARAVYPVFALHSDVDATAVSEICRRLDGIPLAIELAAARMVSMSPQDVRDRLGDRFRLLSGARRGLERHQTLRHAVGWSYDLLEHTERAVLCRCAVFADGFDLAAAAELCEDAGFDEYEVLDTLDSLVRKSLITVEHAGGPARYGMLETIRQYAEEQLAATASIVTVRDRHARYYAEQATAHFAIWDSPQQRNALDWVDSNFANLRAGFRWAADQLDFPAAAAIAAHTTMLGWMLQRYEPVGWAEEILPPAKAADLALLPRLLTAASICLWGGRGEVGAGYAHRAVELEADPRYDPFETGWSAWFEAAGNVFAGHIGRGVEIYADLARQRGVARVLGLGGMLYLLPTVARAEEAIEIAEEAVSAARRHANPSLIAYVLAGQGRALAGSDPERALSVLHEGLRYAREHRLSALVVRFERECALLDAVHGDPVQALTSIEAAIESLHRAGDHDTTAMTLACLAVLFDRAEQPAAAATVHGATVGHASTSLVLTLAVTVQHLRDLLGSVAFERCVAVGAAMDLPEAVRYARQHIALTRAELRSRPQSTPA